MSAFGYSVAIAVLSTLISIVVGTWIAVLLDGHKFFGRTAMFGLALLPALVPGIISAIAFRIYARLLGIEPGMFAIIWAHAIHNVPFVVLIVMARLSTLPGSQTEAARDLGADPLVTYLRITVPWLIPAILGASIFCLLLSFDDFVRSFFPRWLPAHGFRCSYSPSCARECLRKSMRSRLSRSCSRPPWGSGRNGSPAA